MLDDLRAVQTKICAEEHKLADELNYQAYKAHRDENPNIHYCHWSSIFRDVEQWEKRYQWEQFHLFLSTPVKPGIWRTWKEAYHSWGWLAVLALVILMWWVIIAGVWKLWPR